MTSARLLFVDDDQNLCTWVSGALTPRGFEVRTTTSAARAFEWVQAGAFDVVVCDLRLPQLDGVALCDRNTARRT